MAGLETNDERPTDYLRELSEPAWSNATHHRFVEELGNGTIDDEVYARYLVQDYAFVESLVGVFGHAVGEAPLMTAKRRLIEFLDTITSDENDYFERSFDALEVSEDEYLEPKLTDVTREFDDLLNLAKLESGYAETLAVLVPAEWVYETWATNLKDAGREPESFYLSEWIELHANPEFRDFVEWLRGELDSEYDEVSEMRRDKVEYLFKRTVQLEEKFFDSAYI